NVKQLKVEVRDIKQIQEDLFLLSFFSPYISKTANPGNFVHVKIDSVILRRPLSIHKILNDKIYILFKVKGRGTLALSNIKKGEFLDIIGPLGQGFILPKYEIYNKIHNILIAGGIGVAPILFLAQKLNELGKGRLNIKNSILLGASSKTDILYEDHFKEIGYKVEVATDDGSKGVKGFVTDILKNILTGIELEEVINIYACGPEGMFFEMNKILKEYPKVNCQVSFEQFMGCGLGICCGCSVETKDGYKKVCKDGPVFNIKDVW
ncbi:MAG: dihydroorotate dehydrogenase electron transfer subunit, partial [Candidatus Omnitrophica bacterium]|nr:dihydroorotate dehydrogenase electron transfer subunit [Candidatus Omnitrophota bacterium]